MGLFHSGKEKEKGKPQVLSLSASMRVRNKVTLRICENSKLQYFVMILSSLLVLAYLFFSMYNVSYLYYLIERNTSAFKTETNIVGVASYEVNSDGSVSFRTVEGLDYTDEVGIEFITISRGTIPKDTVYYVPSQNVLVSASSVDFVLNYLWGSKTWFVLVYALILEMFRYYISHSGGVVFQHEWTKVVSFSLIILTLVYIGITFCLLA